MLRTVGSQEVSIQKGSTSIITLNCPVTCPVRNLDKTRGTNTGGGKIKSPDISKDGWNHSTSRLQEEAELLRCNNADDWYVRMATNPSPWAVGYSILRVLIFKHWQVDLHLETSLYMCWYVATAGCSHHCWGRELQSLLPQISHPKKRVSLLGSL